MYNRIVVFTHQHAWNMGYVHYVNAMNICLLFQGYNLFYMINEALYETCNIRNIGITEHQ